MHTGRMLSIYVVLQCYLSIDIVIDGNLKQNMEKTCKYVKIRTDIWVFSQDLTNFVHLCCFGKWYKLNT